MKYLVPFLLMSFITLQNQAQNNEYTNEFCELLGILDEYISRFNYDTGEPWNDSIVEGFYKDEIEIANHFSELINKYEKTKNHNFEIIKSVSKEGHIYFYSKDLSRLINSFYILDSFHCATLNIDIILKQSESKRYSYLKGVYLRHGYSNQIILAMAPNKVNTIVSVFNSLDVEDMKVYRSTVKHSYEFIILFPRTKELDETLNMNRREHEINLEAYDLIYK